MPKPRTPTAILKFKGSFRKNPQRARARATEPQAAAPLGNPPDDLAADEKAAWLVIVESCAPGVLSKRDRELVWVAAKVKAKIQRESPWPKDVALLIRCLSLMGMTPADASRVQAVELKAEKAASFAAI
jgi:hypothetical protein